MKKTKLGGVTFNFKGSLKEAIEVLAEIGYEGFEVLSSSPLYQPYAGKPEDLRRSTDEVGISLAGLYYGAPFYKKEDVARDIEGALAVVQDLSRLRGSYLIVGPGPRKEGSLGLTDEEYRCMADALNEIGAECKKLGVPLCFHPHINQTIERRHEIDKLFGLTDPETVKFCVDTGHLYAGGSDPVEIIKKYKNIVAYVHLKDFKDGAYCNLGTGEMDNEAILQALKDIGYSGWILPEVPGRGVQPPTNERHNYNYLKPRLW
ncbi:MAG: sugar phosphate isomerase/epimerase family protein [bacterium]